MGLFERGGYGRDYRDRPDERGGMRGWRSAPPRGYDREWRGPSHQASPPRHPHELGYSASSFAYRGMEGPWSTAFNRGAHDPEWDWQRAAGGRGAYDDEYSGRAGEPRRWEQPPRGAYGGGDRERGLLRGGGYGGRPRSGYDRGYGGEPRGGYDRGYTSGPREGYDRGYLPRGWDPRAGGRRGW
jgi:hypothetical protein